MDCTDKIYVKPDCISIIYTGGTSGSGSSGTSGTSGSSGSSGFSGTTYQDFYYSGETLYVPNVAAETSYSLSGLSITVNIEDDYDSDLEAALAGIAIGELYHTDGVVHIRRFVETGSTIDFLLIAGGGAGGPSAGGGGGGAGGHIYLTGQTITAGSYNIVIGAGGDNDIGGNSTFSGYTALGGGNARAYTNDPSGIGTDGGCGGGGAGSVSYLWSGGTGSQGYNGGSGCLSPDGKPLGGGGGGGGQAGQDGLEDVYAGSGGTGFSCSIYSGTPIYYCGGGGGSVWEPQWNHIEGIGGPGGGGTGSWSGGTQTNAQANTGGGGGGGGGKGGSGVFIVRYLTSIFNTSSSGGTKHTYGNYTVHTFTENGTLVLNNP